MTPFLRTPEWKADDDLFAVSWLLSEPIQDRINRATTGIGLFEAVRYQAANTTHTDQRHGPIADFQYLMINPVLQAIARVTREDCMNLPLSALIPEGVDTTLIRRMAQVVESGLPQHYNDVFILNGVVSQHDQVCLKAGDGVLVLVMDVTYLPLLDEELRRRSELMEAILTKAPVEVIHKRLIALIM